MLARSQKNVNFANQLNDIATRVKTGDSLSAAFEAQTGFPVMYTTTLLAGERSGNLQEVLERYVSFQRISLTFRKKLVASLIYPTVLLSLVTALMFFMFVFVVPQFAVLYDQMGSKLPAMTMDLLAFGKFLNHNILWILLGIAAVATGAYRFGITDRGKDFTDAFRIKLPIFGKIWLKYQVALLRARFPPCSRAVCRWCRLWKQQPAPSLRAASPRRSCRPSRRSAKAKAWPRRWAKPRSFPTWPRR